MNRRSVAPLLCVLWIGMSAAAHAVEVKFQPVAPGAYAFIGEKSGAPTATKA